MIAVTDVLRTDLDGLARLYEELVGKPTNLAKMQDNFVWMHSNPDYIILAAKDEGRVVGSLMGVICHDLAGACRPFMVIENVIVAGSYRGTGVGKLLMQKIEEIAKDRDCYYTMFVSRGDRKDAHQFYASLGYSLDLVQGFKKYL